MLYITYKGKRVPLIKRVELKGASFVDMVEIDSLVFDLWQEKTRLVAVAY